MATHQLRVIGLVLLAGSLALYAQEQGAQDKAAQAKKDAEWRETLAKAPLLPFKQDAFAVKPLTPGWTVNGRISSVATDRKGEVTYLFARVPQGTDPIIAVDRQGRVLRTWGKGVFEIPHSVKVDPQGNVWLLDAGTPRVVKYTPLEEKLLEFVLNEPATKAAGTCVYPDNPIGPFCGATAIAFVPNGRLFLLDGYGKRRAFEYTPKGKEVREWGGGGTGPGKFTVAHGLAYDGKNTLFIADRDGGKIERFDLDGRYLGVWTNVGQPGAIDFANGFLWATTAGSPEPAAAGQPVRTQNWVIKIDPATGKILGKMQTSDTHFIDVNESTGEVSAGLTAGGFFRFSPTR